ncbi:MAG: hypothetical protein ACTIJ3_13115, partial [Halomonadaceae bacterium]
KILHDVKREAVVIVDHHNFSVNNYLITINIVHLTPHCYPECYPGLLSVALLSRFLIVTFEPKACHEDLA